MTIENHKAWNMREQAKMRRLIFVAVRRAVIRGSEMVAQAKSATFARRIANALNKHTPNEKGY